MILDIGPTAAGEIADIIGSAGTILWNGPVGVFEFDQFASGTKMLARAIADSSAGMMSRGLASVSKAPSAS